MSSQELVELVNEGKFTELIKALMHFQDRVSLIRDQQGNSLIHLACSADRGEILDHLLKFVRFK
jgi:hypothetical protein